MILSFHVLVLKAIQSENCPPDRARGYHLAEFIPAFDRVLVAK
jgi:hypothetical protein